MTQHADTQLRRAAISAAFTKLPPAQRTVIRGLANRLSDSIKNEHPKLVVGDQTALEIVGAVGIWLEQKDWDF